MSRFYGTINGQAQTSASRRGGSKTGIEGHIRGWDVGIYVCGFVDNGQDKFRVALTGGSNNPSGKLIGIFSADDLKKLEG